MKPLEIAVEERVFEFILRNIYKLKSYLRNLRKKESKVSKSKLKDALSCPPVINLILVQVRFKQRV